ncbi:MAG: MBL fold metallo-hydrolase [Gemmataceae bacterium]
MKRLLLSLLCIVSLATFAWLSRGNDDGAKAASAWTKIAPGVYRSPGPVAGYALVDGDVALLIDAPTDGAGLDALGVKKIEGVLLTHYHRPSCAAAARLLEKKVPVRAAKTAAEWLTPENVKKYWQESLPLRSSRTAYLVLPEGLPGVGCSLVDGQTINWRSWRIDVLDTPGPARSHLTFLARREKYGPLYAFCGGLYTEPGKLWAPYTTDWDHWTDAGLAPTATSIRKLAARYPDVLLPAHGRVLDRKVQEALRLTAENVEEAGFLKSFERYTKQRLGDAPRYKFLAIEQAESNGSKPWSQVSEHLYLTGNTYVLVSKDNACLLIDPWAKRSVDQFELLKKEKKLGPLEVVWFSHAHYDHYDGIYDLPERKDYKVWSLDLVSLPLKDPFLLRAPFLDPRPIAFDQTPTDGAELTWREYRFRFHHFPGQSYYTMAVEGTIDGKRCLFTADNFFHQDMFSGTGGWMGLNRSSPVYYAQSAKRVLDLAPEWVLAEHGGPFEFNAEDFRRRVQWGEETARVLDVVCLSGNHLADWDPSRVHVEPVLQKAKPGATIKGTLVASNRGAKKETLAVTLEGRGVVTDQTWKLEVGREAVERREVAVTLPATLTAGRHVFALRVEAGGGLDGGDAFFVVEVE